MSIVIELPSTMRPFASGEKRVALPDKTSFPRALDTLITRHPRLRNRLVTSSGTLYDFVGVFVNDRRMSRTEIDELVLDHGDRVTFVPAMAGG